ncbi:hypothetical protein AMJ80_10545 [bacterium SM23_31]|nr:MAG: hypothetical protein AMJ80_10545 [bacterium SM23_31]
MMSTLVYAQEKQTQEKKPDKKFVVDENFLTTWKKVGHLTKEIRSFKTEKAVTVAGVRGTEATNEALRLLYFKGGVPYPSQLALKNAVDMLEAFVKENPKDSTVVECKFYIAQCSFQIGDNKKTITFYEDIVNNHPKSEYAALAKEELEKVKEK